MIGGGSDDGHEAAQSSARGPAEAAAAFCGQGSTRGRGRGRGSRENQAPQQVSPALVFSYQALGRLRSSPVVVVAL